MLRTSPWAWRLAIAAFVALIVAAECSLRPYESSLVGDDPDCQFGALVDCIHGHYFCNRSDQPWGLIGWCVCDPGWTGVDCSCTLVHQVIYSHLSVCTTPDVCVNPLDPTITCDRTFQAYSQKEFQCNISGKYLFVVSTNIC